MRLALLITVLVGLLGCSTDTETDTPQRLPGKLIGAITLNDSTVVSYTSDGVDTTAFAWRCRPEDRDAAFSYVQLLHSWQYLNVVARAKCLSLSYSAKFLRKWDGDINNPWPTD